MTVQVPEELAARIKTVRQWLPTIIEISLIGYKTLAASVASEVITFLMSNPAPEAVINFKVSEKAQSRLQRLLALNEQGMLSEEEQAELDELQQLEHVLLMLKAQLNVSIS